MLYFLATLLVVIVLIGNILGMEQATAHIEKRHTRSITQEKFANLATLGETISIIEAASILALLKKDSCNLKTKRANPLKKTKKKSQPFNLLTKKPLVKNLRCKFKDCQKSYAVPDLLEAHENKHLGLKPYPCTLGCSISFASEGYLKQHLRRFHRIFST